MKLGILSDSHDNQAAVKSAFNIFESQGVDYVIHCGDWTKPETLISCSTMAEKLGFMLAGVVGNRDDAVVLQEANQHLSQPIYLNQNLHLSLSGVEIGVCHGHSSKEILKLIQKGCEVIFRGHSHKPIIANQGDTLIINPGSIAFSIPRSKKFIPTVALFDTQQKLAEIVEYKP